MVEGGKSTLTEALHLHNLGVDVSIVHRRDSFRAQDHLVHNVERSGIRVLFNSEVQVIHGREKVESVTLKNSKTGEMQSLEMYLKCLQLAKKKQKRVQSSGTP
jgi:thioredoxin reductase (NADPH)